MEMVLNNGFCEMTFEEKQEVDGGKGLADGIAILEFTKDCFMFGFNVGRQLAREVKEWYSEPEFIIVEGEPIS